MIRNLVVGFIAALLLPIFSLAETDVNQAADSAQITDTTKIYHLQSVIEVTGKRIRPSLRAFPIEKDQFATVLNTNGFALIRKGVFFAQDIYADGFKRGDIQVVVDGERYHSACPNRMDSPLTRANPLEMASIDLVKNSSALQSGLGGAVNFHRENPGEPLKIRAGLSQAAGVTGNSDGAFSITKSKHTLDGRYATGRGYDDAEGRSFVDLYGYRQDYTYRLAEGSFMGRTGDWKYRAALTYSDDVMFPYLQMDERVNRVISGFVSYRGNKAYVNHTSHVMDNGLRVSTMSMVTDASNTTVGLTGGFYEAYYRHWNADNRIITPMATIENHLMPDVTVIGGALQKSYSSLHWGASAKAGAIYHRMGDDARLDFYKPLYPDAKQTRLIPTFGFTGFYKSLLANKIIGVLTAEIASDAPATENMYITVRKPMGKPNWMGNPTLDQPVKAGLRGSLAYRGASIELFATQVWNYINFIAATAGTTKYMTYDNIDAVLTGANISGQWKYLDLSAFYTWANNSTNDSAMAEIPPLMVMTTLKSPNYRGLKGQLRHTFADAQTRIDESLGEQSSPSWHRLDANVSYAIGALRLVMDVENITDELYHQHMSYLRDPYAAGVQLYEPGRTFRFTVVFDELFAGK